MNKISVAAFTALALGGLLWADHHEHAYKKKATAHDLMEVVVKPTMDQLAALREAGGPQEKKDWKHSNAWASVLAESGQLLLMDGRVKDEVWADGAKQLIAGAEATMKASMRMDAEGWNAGLAAMGGGCESCHTAHKPKKK